MNDQGDLNEEFLKQAIKDANPLQFPNFTEVKTNLEKKAKANIAHTPRQQGPFIICVSCPNQHTLKYIGPNKKLAGLDEGGNYVIEDRF